MSAWRIVEILFALMIAAPVAGLIIRLCTQ